MRAFLSHSSADKLIVVGVHSELEPDSTWLDRAEIEWGDLFLEKIADGIQLATDFVLFWSKAASKSEWVRIEIRNYPFHKPTLKWWYFAPRRGK